MPPTPAVPVLMYHSVADEIADSFRDFTVTAARFREHLAALRDAGWRTISLTQAAGRLHRQPAEDQARVVALTFDDGYADFYSHALPALAAEQARATLFVPTAHVGRRAGWLRGPDAERPLLDWPALADVAATGVEIGSHGHHHAPLDVGGHDDIHQDLAMSRHILEDRLATAVTALAYPYGYQTGKSRRAARRAGYHAACTVVGLPATSGDPVLALPRIAVTQDMTGADVVAALACPPRLRRPWRKGKQHLWHAARKTGLMAPHALGRGPRP